MKHTTKKIISLAIAVAMVLGMATTVFAANVPTVSEGYTLTKVNAKISNYGNHYFHNGLMPLMEVLNVDENGYTDTKWTYLNTKGQLVDLGEKAYGFDFSEGLAAFSENGIGYMDKTGKVIIPAKFDAMDSLGVVQSGCFINGNALVFQSTGTNQSGTTEGEWVQIDKTGKIVKKTLDENADNVIYSDVTGNLNGISKETVIINGQPTEFKFSEGLSLLCWSEDEDYYLVSKTLTNPTTPKKPTASDKVTATSTNSKVLVNKQSTDFEAYLINQNNYFKLRDIAKVVRGTDKQFEVNWDGTKKAINLVTGKAYTVVGGELAKGDGTAKDGTLNTATIYKDGQVIQLTAYTIKGNNYFKLRDLCSAFDIGVTWDGTTNTVGIDTSIAYTAE